jgi:hypothetical protein
MKDLNEYSNEDLTTSLIAETAKALSEVRKVQGDLDKINGRLRFILTVVNILKEERLK